MGPTDEIQLIQVRRIDKVRHPTSDSCRGYPFCSSEFSRAVRSFSASAEGETGSAPAVVTHKGNEQQDFFPTARYGWEAKRAGKPAPIAANYTLRASRGRMAAKAMMAVRERGISPKLIIGHLGWGETLFAKDVFPDATLVVHAEFFYSADRRRRRLRSEFPLRGGIERLFELRAKNAAILAAMNDADFAVAPTRWQASRFPPYLQSKLRIVHEGINTELVKPNPAATYRVPGANFTFKAAMKSSHSSIAISSPTAAITSLCARCRRFSARPSAHVVIVGGDSTSYGAAAPAGQTWKEIFLSEVREQLPLKSRAFRRQGPICGFCVTVADFGPHVYLTYPFVLSWSMLEAMSAGAPLIASSTRQCSKLLRMVLTGSSSIFLTSMAWPGA